MAWFGPAWEQLTEDDRYVLECFYMGGNGPAVNAVCERFQIERNSAYWHSDTRFSSSCVPPSANGSLWWHFFKENQRNGVKTVAKDGSGRGGARPGAGRKPKALTEPCGDFDRPSRLAEIFTRDLRTMT